MLLAAPSVRQLIGFNFFIEFDAQLIVDDQSVQIHRNYMSLISPVFAAMFKEGTKEAQTGHLDIPDFTYEIVKRAIDYCYGESLVEESAHSILDIYRFADKYDIAAIRKTIDDHFEKDSITEDTFCDFLSYASEQNNDEVMKRCAKFLKDNMHTTLRSDFIALESDVMKETLNLAAELIKETMAEKESEPVRFVHKTTSCDVCQVYPIIGIRYKCAVCSNYDMCENCERKGLHAEHVLLRMANDKSNFGIGIEDFAHLFN
uniref:BTB domain-containing protein n=1 Tax=Panagrellus redivivus TaxID=6233 RepID=A0A7E4UTP7_PANRE